MVKKDVLIFRDLNKTLELESSWKNFQSKLIGNEIKKPSEKTAFYSI